MKYDFESHIDREGKDALAVDVIPFEGAKVKLGFTKLPMWIADMNFAVPSAIQDAVIERMKHPAYGYFSPSEDYFNSIIRWQQERNQVKGLSKEDIGYENGVLGCVASAMTAFTSPGDAVLVHAPAYIGFSHVLEDNGRKTVLSYLKRDEQGVWRMDYADMEAKIKKYHIHLAIFCSPHNPTGRVWERTELEQAMEIYRRNDCLVISDEIWSDLTLGEYQHIPTQSISADAKNRTIAVYAPSKTFNLAGLVGSYHIVYNNYLRDRLVKEAQMTHYNSMNVLSMHALIGSYKKEGQEWLSELKQVLARNVDYAYDFILKNFDGVTLAKPQGTYMLYLDCSQWCKSNGKSIEELLKAGIAVGVIWQDGRPFHCPDSIRMNLALPHSEMVEAFDRLNQYVFKN